MDAKTEAENARELKDLFEEDSFKINFSIPHSDQSVGNIVSPERKRANTAQGNFTSTSSRRTTDVGVEVNTPHGNTFENKELVIDLDHEQYDITHSQNTIDPMSPRKQTMPVVQL